MAGQYTFYLLKTRRFLPLMLTQFMGALNDNLFRAAIIMLITYRLAQQTGTHPAILNNLAIAFFIAPFFLFSALAGQLADKFEKSSQIVWIKIWELMLMIAGAFGFIYENLIVLMAVLTGLGLQSTFFGPIKYGILPDLMKRDELLAANALVEAGTFLAILLGTTIGGLAILSTDGPAMIIVLTISVALCGIVSARFITKTGQAAPTLVVRRNIAASTAKLLRDTWSSSIARPTVIGISWVWMVGAIVLSQIPVLVKDYLSGNQEVVTLILACFSVGVGTGAILCNRWLKGAISSKLAAPGIVAVFLLSTILYALLPGAVSEETIYGIGYFLQIPLNWVLLSILILISLALGAVIVPLYAILQDKSRKEERSRQIAANNIINAAFMAIGSVIAAVLIALGITTDQIMLIVGAAGLVIVPILKAIEKRL